MFFQVEELCTHKGGNRNLSTEQQLLAILSIYIPALLRITAKNFTLLKASEHRTAFWLYQKWATCAKEK